jgi:hypothetical protein
LPRPPCITLYNGRPTWLQHAHAALDRAVWVAYGWPEDEVPAEVAEDVILSGLLGLNGERGVDLAAWRWESVSQRRARHPDTAPGRMPAYTPAGNVPIIAYIVPHQGRECCGMGRECGASSGAR